MSPIELRNVSLSRNNTVVLHNIDLAIPGGEWTSIVGSNGAGKSTLVQALAGLLPYEGSIQIGGVELHSITTKARAQQIAWLEQATATSDNLDVGLRVYDIAMLGRLPHQNWLSIASADDHLVVEQAMRQTAVWDLRERFFSQLSGGERQRVLLARLFAVQADTLLMDEPIANLDPPHQADWLQWQTTLSDQGKTSITVLHEIQFALQAENLILLGKKGVHHQGKSDDPLTHQALIDLFDGRIELTKLGKHWVALTR
ncbi:ABC transporter ATP-binding protein [Polynucleobacter difficilis]|uniref:ABC transporter ATP-binding protein n=1 Tax=Polynucleobacter difficilis TaxID=556054 RepID=UPI000D3846C2|nr:ABC transporter ATP-binding protein [Polynucleobacter difficilis]